MTIAQYRAWAKATFLDDAAEVEEKESATSIIANYVGGMPAGAHELVEGETQAYEKRVAFHCREACSLGIETRWLDIDHVKKLGTPTARASLRFFTAASADPKAATFYPPVYVLDIASGNVAAVIMPLTVAAPSIAWQDPKKQAAYDAR
jgi:hypothetical protein